MNLTETKTDVYGTYTTIWHDSAPEEGRPFKVIRQTWNADLTVRDVYDWEYADALPSQPGGAA